MPFLTLAWDLLVAGVCLGAVLHHVQVAFARKDLVHATFALPALCAAGIELATAAMYLSWTPELSEQAQWWRLLCAVTGGPTLTLYLWAHTRSIPVSVLLPLAAPSIAVPLLHLVIPGGIGPSVVEVMAWQTAWGETLAYPDGDLSIPARILLGSTGLWGFGLCIALCVRYIRGGHRLEGGALLAGVAMLIASSTHDVLAEAGVGGPPLLAGAGFLGMVGLGSWLLSSEVVAADVARAQEARTESWLRTILDALPDGVIVVDEMDRVVAMNPSAVRVLGPEIAGQPLSQVLEAGGWKAMGREAPGEGQLLRKGSSADSREMLRMDASTSTQGEGGTHVVVLRDVTAEFRLRKRLESSARLDAVARLAAGTAHDFNNLLMVIGGAADALQEELSSSHPEHAAVQDIVDATERASNLTRMLLTFGREASNVREPVDMHIAVRRAVDLVQRSAREPVDIDVHLGASHALVLGDATQLESVVLNLLRNAVDAVEPGGQIRVVTSVDQKDLVVRVQDNGVGIAPEALAHIFEPFYTTKAPGRGTGLGLASVYGAVTAHEGTVEVESTRGSGTTFRVRVPLARNTRRLEAPSVGENPRILLVDDEPSVRRTTGRVLRHLGAEVVEAGSGEAAMARFQSAQDSFDVLVADVLMPGMTGVTLLELVRQARPDIPCVLITAYADHSELERARAMPRVVVLAKPFRTATLAGALKQVGVELSKQSLRRYPPKQPEDVT